MNFLFKENRTETFHQKLQDYLEKGHSKERFEELITYGDCLEFPRSTVFKHAVEIMPNDRIGGLNFLRDLHQDSVGIFGKSDRHENYLYGLAMNLTMKKAKHFACVEGDALKGFFVLAKAAYSLLEENERLRDAMNNGRLGLKDSSCF